MPKSNNGTDKSVPRKKRGSARSIIHFPDIHPVPPQATSFVAFCRNTALKPI